MKPSPTPPESLWTQDESLQNLRARLATRPPGLQVVSFDCFDTLILRLCAEPSDLFIEVGRQLTRENLLLTPLSPREFRAVRQAADERARDLAVRKGRSPEIQLADIYAQLHNVVRDPDAARRVEFGVERSLCYPNPAMASLVRHVRELGLRTAVLSDTYFNSREIESLLTDNGLPPDLFDALILSSVRGKGKWNSHLYHELFQHFDIHPTELLHVGDNLHADVQRARQLGVQTVYYYRTTPHLDAIFQGEHRFRGAGAILAGSFDSLRVLTGRQASQEDDAFRDGAFVFGPVLTRYADWCVEHFRASGVRTVLALMREGEVLGELVSRSAAAAEVELNVVPCFASRLATARAAMSEVTPEKAAELLEGSAANLTPQTVLDILGVGDEGSRFLDLQTRTKPLGGPEGIAGFLRLLFRLPRLRQLLEDRRAESHALACEYLTGLIGNETQIGVVDLGWSGSIQRNIARILRRGGHQVRTLGCYLACTRRAGRLALDGDVTHAFLEQDWSRSTILPEVAITASFGSTDRYARDASGVVQPVLGPYATTPDESRVKERLRDGIFAFQSRWLELRQSRTNRPFSREILNDLDQQSGAILYRLLEFPTKPEADRLGALRHDENYFGENYSAPLCDEEMPKRLRCDGVQGLLEFPRCYWPQGVIARSQPRLITALRAGWSQPSALGRLGAWHGVALTDSGLTDHELSSLGSLLHGLQADQVVFPGTLAPVVEEVFLHLWQKSDSASRDLSPRPRLIVPGTNETPDLRPEFLERCALLPGAAGDPATLRDIRRHLAPEATIALVLTPALTSTDTNALLSGLAPFLGLHGFVLAACGRDDPNTVNQDQRLARLVHDWSGESGREIGYDLWNGPTSARPHLANWIVFRRSTDHRLWNRQWTLTVSDLGLTPTELPSVLTPA